MPAAQLRPFCHPSLPKWFVGCRYNWLPFIASISREQLFQYLQDTAAVMVAFHYAHTDAVQSMQHFDMMLAEDQQQLNTVDHTSSADQGQLQPADYSNTQQSPEHAASSKPDTESLSADSKQPKHPGTAGSAAKAATGLAALSADESADASGAAGSSTQEEQPVAHETAAHGTNNNNTTGRISAASARQANTGLTSHGAVEVKKARIIQGVIQESKDQLAVVEQHLCALHGAYPEVLASVRSRQVAQEMLLVKEAYIHELQASGRSPCEPF